MTSTMATIALALVAALVAFAAAAPPAVHAGRCDEPYLRSLSVDDGELVLRLYPDDDAGCWPVEAELSYGSSSSANIHRLRVAFTNTRLRVDIRDLKLGGRIYMKARTINEDGDKSGWSDARKVRIPSPPPPLPTPRVRVHPAEYDGGTDRIRVSWSNGGDAERFEIQVFAEDTEIDGDRTREREKSYRIDTRASFHKVRVRGVTDRSFSAWSDWAYTFRADEPPTPIPTVTPPPTATTVPSPNAPSATKVAPTADEVEVQVGESVTFKIRADDADRDAVSAEWYINGEWVA